jgi:hypothetical protein
VCVCVCVFACVFACVYVCMHACYVCLEHVSRTCVLVQTIERARTSESARERETHTQQSALTHQPTHTPTHPHTHTHARAHTQTHTHTHTQASDLAAAMPEVYGPGTLRTYLLDQLYLVSSETLTQRMKVQEVPAE